MSKVQNPQTPELMNMKFGLIDYVGDITPHAKIQKDRPTPVGCPGIWMK